MGAILKTINMRVTMDNTSYSATSLPSNPGELARMVEGLLTEDFRLKQQNLRLLKYLLHGQTEGQQRAV